MAVRRVRRVVRRIDPWTVLKVSFVFNTIAALVFVLGSWVAWSIAVQRGIPGRISSIAAQLTLTYVPDGPLYFRIVVFFAIVTAVGLTGLLTLAAVLYNLIADLVGGVEFIVLEETFTAPPTRVRPAVHRPTVTTEPVPAETPVPVGEP